MPSLREPCKNAGQINKYTGLKAPIVFAERKAAAYKYSVSGTPGYIVEITDEALKDMEQLYNHIAFVLLALENAMEQYNRIS